MEFPFSPQLFRCNFKDHILHHLDFYVRNLNFFLFNYFQLIAECPGPQFFCKPRNCLLQDYEIGVVYLWQVTVVFGFDSFDSLFFGFGEFAGYHSFDGLVQLNLINLNLLHIRRMHQFLIPIRLKLRNTLKRPLIMHLSLIKVENTIFFKMPLTNPINKVFDLSRIQLFRILAQHSFNSILIDQIRRKIGR